MDKYYIYKYIHTHFPTSGIKEFLLFSILRSTYCVLDKTADLWIKTHLLTVILNAINDYEYKTYICLYMLKAKNSDENVPWVQNEKQILLFTIAPNKSVTQIIQ